MSALKFRAHAHAPRAQNAAVVVEDEAGMRHIDRQFGKVISEAYGVDAERGGHSLKLAMSVRDADSTYVVAFDEKQFQRYTAIASQLRGGRRDRHPFLDRRSTSGEKAF